MKGSARHTRHRTRSGDQLDTPSNRTAGSAAILGHELDNVLNCLLGINRLLLESGLNPEQERWSRVIEGSGRQLRSLVSAYRQGVGQLPGSERDPAGDCAREPLDGVELLEQGVLCQVPSATLKGNRLLLTVDPDVPRQWRGDACRLRQLLDNLLGNANKFTDHGEIELYAECDGVTGGLRLAVTDSGPGIDPATGSRIFEAWERDSGSGCPSAGGSGLGLYVCRQAAAAMGGTIRLVSPPAAGARFEVRLPDLLPANEPPGAGPPGIGPSSLLLRLEARLDLGGVLRRSLAAWLDRLGVAWCGVGQAAPLRQGALPIRISELPPATHTPGPLLLLTPMDCACTGDHARRLHGPIVGSTLGPALLQMALEWLWFRDGSPDSTHGPCR